MSLSVSGSYFQHSPKSNTLKQPPDMWRYRKLTALMFGVLGAGEAAASAPTREMPQTFSRKVLMRLRAAAAIGRGRLAGASCRRPACEAKPIRPGRRSARRQTATEVGADPEAARVIVARVGEWSGAIRKVGGGCSVF